MAPPIGFSLPFSLASGSQGILEVTNTEIEATRANILSLLITNWGERLMRINYGCNLIEFLFEPEQNNDLRNRISDRIKHQVATYLDYVRLDDVKIVFDGESTSLPEHSIFISLKFSIIGRPDLASQLNFLATP